VDEGNKDLLLHYHVETMSILFIEGNN